MGQKPQESSIWLFAQSLYPTVYSGAMCETALGEGKSLYRQLSHRKYSHAINGSYRQQDCREIVFNDAS